MDDVEGLLEQFLDCVFLFVRRGVKYFDQSLDYKINDFHVRICGISKRENLIFWVVLMTFEFFHAVGVFAFLTVFTLLASLKKRADLCFKIIDLKIRNIFYWFFSFLAELVNTMSVMAAIT